MNPSFQEYRGVRVIITTPRYISMMEFQFRWTVIYNTQQHSELEEKRDGRGEETWRSSFCSGVANLAENYDAHQIFEIQAFACIITNGPFPSSSSIAAGLRSTNLNFNRENCGTIAYAACETDADKRYSLYVDLGLEKVENAWRSLFHPKLRDTSDNDDNGWKYQHHRRIWEEDRERKQDENCAN